MTRLVPLLFGFYLLTGVIYSCMYTPVDPPTCDTCTVPCDTCEVPCDTCDTTRPTIADTTSHAFTWSEYSIPVESSLPGVWVFDSNDVFASGARLHRFNGTSWRQLQVKTAGGQSVNLSGMRLFAFAPGDCWFVYGTVLIQGVRDDAEALIISIHRLDSLSLPTLHACWGTSSTDMYFVGNAGTIVHFDGAKWTKFPKVTTKNLRSVWGTSRSNVWAAGFNSTTAESALLHFDGTAWTDIDPRTVGDIGVGQHGLFGVWTYDSAGKIFDYTYGSLFHRRVNHGQWSADTLGNKLGVDSYAPLNFVRGNASNDLLVSGGGGYTAHWSGRTWKDFPALFNWSGNYDIFNMSYKGNTVALVGYKNGEGYVAIGRRP